MKCHFRKQNKEQTNGVTYPFRKPHVSTRAAEAAGLVPAPRRSKSVDLLATMEEVDFSYCEGCRFMSGYGNNRICVDCGCAYPSYGGQLGCIRLDDMREFYSGPVYDDEDNEGCEDNDERVTGADDRSADREE